MDKDNLRPLPAEDGQFHGNAAALAGLHQHPAPVGLGHPQTQRQTQPQAVGRRVHPLRVAVALKYRGQLLLRNAGSRVGDENPGRVPVCFQFHGDGPSGGGKFDGVGEELVKGHPQGLRVGVSGTVVHGTAEAQIQAHVLRQVNGPRAHVAHQVRQIAVLGMDFFLSGQVSGVAEIVDHAQEQIVTLVHDGGPAVQGGRVLSGIGGHGLGGRHVQIGQGHAHMVSHSGEQGGGFFGIHRGAPFRRPGSPGRRFRPCRTDRPRKPPV